MVSSRAAVTTLVADVSSGHGVSSGVRAWRAGWSHGETVNRAGTSTEFAGLSADATEARRRKLRMPVATC